MAYMSKTKRRRVMRQRLLALAIVIAALIAIFIAIWQIGLGSTLAKVNGTSIRSGNVQGVTYFYEYQEYGMIYSNTDTSDLTASAKTAADDSLLVERNGVVKNIFVPTEVLRNHFKAEGRTFPSDEEKTTIKESLDSLFSDRSTSEMFNTNGIKRAHVEYFLEYSAAVSALQKEVLEKNPIAEEDARKYYDENLEKFSQFTLQASHILLQDPEHTPEKRAEIEAILERAKNGEDFAELAKEFSDDTSAENGGDVGTFGPGQMVEPFEKAAFALEPEEISSVVETVYGYHIIKLTSKTIESVLPFEDEAVQTTIEVTLGEPLTTAELEKLTNEATIEYFGLVNPTTGKPPVTQAELDEARGTDASVGASDGGSAATPDAGSAITPDGGNAAAEDSSAATPEGSNAASPDGGSATVPDDGNAATADTGDTTTP